MGIFDASTSASGNVSQSSNFSNASSNGATYGNVASSQALANMREANAFTEKMWNKQAEYNSREAQIARDWQERLANTTYQRTIQDMIKAGINPILAAGSGLSADSVTSGATASVAGATGQALGAYPDSVNSSISHAEGQSTGSGWSSSESGLAQFLTSMGEWVTGAIGALSSSHTINIALQGLENFVNNVDPEKIKDTAKDAGLGALSGLIPGIGNLFSLGKSAKKIVEKAKEGNKE